MKKYLSSYGSVVLYLFFAYGLDRYLHEARMMFGRTFELANLELVMTLYNLIFAMASIAFLYMNFNINEIDWKYHLVQSVLGFWWISLIAFRLSANLRFFPFSLYRNLINVGVDPFGMFSIAMNIIAVLGVLGLVKWWRRDGKDEIVS